MLASYLRTDAQQRTGPHLGGELSVTDRAGTVRRCPRRPSQSSWSAIPRKPEGRAALKRALSEARLREAAVVVLNTSPDVECSRAG